MLIHTKTAKMIAIDFGVAFDLVGCRHSRAGFAPCTVDIAVLILLPALSEMVVLVSLAAQRF